MSNKSQQTITMVGMLNYQSTIFDNATKDITDEQASIRPGDSSNNINWLLGHVLTCRYMLANILGVPDQDPHGKIYFQGLADENYSDIKKIKEYWPGISEKLVDKISELTNEELYAEIPNMGKKFDLINFFIYHEAYHLGQIGYARKLLGFTTMKSN